MNQIKPQEGFQEKFLSSPADIVIGGGAAGPGKTFALLLEPFRHIYNPQFGGVIFRRTYPQITNEGGLWDKSKKLYPLIAGTKSNESALTYQFPSGAKIKFSHLQHEKNAEDWQGTEIIYIGFDELTHFTEYQFFYLLSRNRSTSGISPYLRATCNPDPESWVARFIDWWIDQDTGFPIKERDGVIRYYIRDQNQHVWGDTPEEVIAKCPHIFEHIPVKDKTKLVKSVTYIHGDVYGNQILMKEDPGYLGNLLSQDESTQARLLHGNWKIKTSGDNLIKYECMADAFTNTFLEKEHEKSRKFITADIAFHGSDMFVMYYWQGMCIKDCRVIQKADGKIIEDAIKAFAEEHKVPRSQIIYDADGAGTYLRGYLHNAIPFVNNSRAIEVKGQKVNYQHLKAQCYYTLAEDINNARVFIAPKVATQRIGNKFVKDYIMDEVKAIKNGGADNDGKLKLIPKEQMKNVLGRSPDFLDAMMMRKFFDFRMIHFSSKRAHLV